MPSLDDNSRSIHSLNLSILDSQRIAREQAEILYKQNMRKFLKVENYLYSQFENLIILTNEELEAKINQAYKKIVMEVLI